MPFYLTWRILPQVLPVDISIFPSKNVDVSTVHAGGMLASGRRDALPGEGRDWRPRVVGMLLSRIWGPLWRDWQLGGLRVVPSPLNTNVGSLLPSRITVMCASLSLLLGLGLGSWIILQLLWLVGIILSSYVIYNYYSTVVVIIIVIKMTNNLLFVSV